MPSDKTFSQLYPTLATLLSRGVHLEVNGGGYHLTIAGLHEDEQMICQFMCGGMNPDDIFKRLEELAVRYEDEGIATDDVNGGQYSVW